MSSIKTIILAVVGAIAIVGAIGWGSYNVGYDNGVQYVQNEVTKQKQDWEKQINDLQQAHNIQLATLTQQHKDSVANLNKQIETLKKHPKIITKYVTDNKISNGITLIHDRSVNKVPLSTMIPDNIDVNQVSEYSETDLANTLAINYSNCNICVERLDALQKIIKQYQQNQSQVIEK